MSVLVGENGKLIMINGVLTDKVDAEDRGLFYGDGLFETLSYQSGHVNLWLMHKQRLLDGCKRLGLKLTDAKLSCELTSFLQQLMLEGVDAATLKIVVTRSSGGRGYGSEGCDGITLAIYAYPAPSYPPEYSRQGINLYLCQQPIANNPMLAGLKHLSALGYVLARNEWLATDCQEGLLFSQSGSLLECCFSNIFIVSDEVLRTPDLSLAGVAGVMRRYISDCLAPSLGLDVQVGTITMADLEQASEVFCCNSLYGIWPVLTCSQLRWNKGVNTQKLQDVMQRDLTSHQVSYDQL